jgi:16S rRNA (uracil1498-N3)-methyltransferase
MQTPLFYEEAAFLAPGTVALSETNARHLVQVLRKSAGYAFRLTNGKGAEAEAILQVAGKKSAAAKIISVVQHPQPVVRLTLAVAFTKAAARNEWLLEKATELGVHRIIPLLTQHGESEKFKEVRWKGILVSALQQSNQYWLPQLETPQKWAAFLGKVPPPAEALFIAHCAEELPRKTFANALPAGVNTTLLIGPEGDFSPAEIAGALTQNFVPVTLGQARLRTETAAITGAAYFRVLNDI